MSYYTKDVYHHERHQYPAPPITSTGPPPDSRPAPTSSYSVPAHMPSSSYPPNPQYSSMQEQMHQEANRAAAIIDTISFHDTRDRSPRGRDRGRDRNRSRDRDRYDYSHPSHSHNPSHNSHPPTHPSHPSHNSHPSHPPSYPPPSSYPPSSYPAHSSYAPPPGAPPYDYHHPHDGAPPHYGHPPPPTYSSYPYPDPSSSYSSYPPRSSRYAHSLEPARPYYEKRDSSHRTSRSLKNQQRDIHRPVVALSTTNVYLNGLPFEWDMPEVEEYFQRFGRIVSVNIWRDHKTGKSRGSGFVDFENPQCAQECIDAMRGFVFPGCRKLIVKFADVRKPKDHRDTRGGGGGGHSKGGGGGHHRRESRGNGGGRNHHEYRSYRSRSRGRRRSRSESRSRSRSRSRDRHKNRSKRSTRESDDAQKSQSKEPTVTTLTTITTNEQQANVNGNGTANGNGAGAGANAGVGNEAVNGTGNNAQTEGQTGAPSGSGNIESNPFIGGDGERIAPTDQTDKVPVTLIDNAGPKNATDNTTVAVSNESNPSIPEPKVASTDASTSVTAVQAPDNPVENNPAIPVETVNETKKAEEGATDQNTSV